MMPSQKPLFSEKMTFREAVTIAENPIHDTKVKPWLHDSLPLIKLHAVLSVFLLSIYWPASPQLIKA
jgi:hypothetical protein